MERPAAMWWNGSAVSDHNRSPISVTVERIERSSRMADGTLRKYVIAKKRSWSTSWDMLPHSNESVGGMGTVDGGMDAAGLENFHNNTDGPFTLEIKYGDGTVKTYTVMFSEFSKEIQKRGLVDFWAVNVTLVQV